MTMSTLNLEITLSSTVSILSKFMISLGFIWYICYHI